MRLSKRIYALSELVQQGAAVADIGTDHGYVPMLLVKNGISPRVIMSDISEGSLAKARETFAIAGIHIDEADFRVGDGLSTIGKSEVDEIIVAGLGGHTIVDILEADEEKTKSFKELILQPRKHSGALRHYLYTHGWDIIDEVLSKEGKFECEIITAKTSLYERREECYPEDDIRWKYPRKMAESNTELARSRIEWKISSIDEQIENLRRSSRDRDDLIVKLEADKEYLRDLIL
ncbi:MAG: SAM-dependent methyltransferase [Mogibacterium sp.]|nr:SAM-dependent methyltransferase [Mogibacterium sp.]